MSGFYTFVLRQEVSRYQSLLQRMSSHTVYHELDYLLAEEQAEDGDLLIFCGEYGQEIVMMPVIQRDIGKLPGLSSFAGFYDVKTPHEYSGALASKDESGLYQCFYSDFATYCSTHGIVFGFFRFNPYRHDMTAAIASGYSVHQSDEQIWIDISEGTEVAYQLFRPSVRRNVRRALQSTLVCELVPASADNMRLFMELYKKAMDYLKATPFFYFTAEYFCGLSMASCTRLLFVRHGETVVAATILLDDKPNKRVYYHLGCFDRNYSLCRPMDFLYYAICQFAESWGRRAVHLGGGAETLHRFKAGFSPKRVLYYVGSRIFLEEQYVKICDLYLRLHPEMSSSQYMPLYRS